MDPRHWGKSAWKFYHDVALGYPDNPTEEDKRNYYTFYATIQNILPCGTCRANERTHFDNRPLTLDDLKDRESLVSWTIDHHNAVNAMLGKRLLNKSEAFDQMTKKPKYGLYIGGGIAIIAILILIVYLAKKK